jgi:outer membrane protein assembly factor BamB
MSLRCLLLLAAVLASACAGNQDTAEPPADLVPIDSVLRIRKDWSAHVGGDYERLRLGLRPATDGASVFAGSHNGHVAAFNAEDGHKVWSVKTGLPLAAGPAYGSDVLVFGSSNGDLVALDASNGDEIWRVQVGSEVLAPPAIGRDVVVYATVDGRLRGVSLTSGEQIWSVEQTLPILTLRGSPAPLITGPIVVSGFDNGRVGAYDITNGELLWEVAVGNSSGRNELERLVDVGAGLQVAGNDVYTAGYQGRAVSIDLRSGVVVWQQDISSYAGLGVDAEHVYVTNDVGAVIALDRRSGTEVWRQGALRMRDVTAPTRFGDALVVGDYDGYLHWLDPETGEFLGRRRGAGERITTTPLVLGLRLYVQADDGTVASFSVVDQSG